MNEITYITTKALNFFAEDPSRVVTVLGYVSGLTLLVAMISDSVLRRRRPARQKRSTESRIGNHRK